MKKVYNNTWMLLMIALCTFSFMACQELNIDSQPEGPLNIQIDAQDTYTALATSPSNVVFNISSNTPWTIESDQQWCKPTPAMSAASSLVSEIVVTIESNTEEQSRTATLTIQAEGIDKPKVITITQASKEDLQVIPYDGVVPTAGAVITFDIVSNKSWKIIPSTQFVSSMDKTSGEGNENGEKETITLTIPGNSGAKREGTITVKTDFEEFTFTVTQDGIVIEQEEPSESGTIDFSNTELEKTIKIRANKAWKASVPKEFADWMEVEAVNDSELKITLKSSNRLATRKGKILLSTKEIVAGYEGVLLDVTQASQFTLGSGIYTIDEETGNIKISKCNIASKFPVKKGHLTFEFAEMNLTGTSNLLFNMYAQPGKGDANFYFRLQSHQASVFQCGGGFPWGAKNLSLTTAEVSVIRKIEFYVEDDPINTGKLQLRMLINGVEKALLNNKTNIYKADPDNNPGQIISLQIAPATTDDYYVIKSITYEEEE